MDNLPGACRDVAAQTKLLTLPSSSKGWQNIAIRAFSLLICSQIEGENSKTANQEIPSLEKEAPPSKGCFHPSVVGAEPGASPELWLLPHPAQVQALQAAVNPGASRANAQLSSE